MKIFEFFIQRASSPLMVVKSSLSLIETISKLNDVGISPLSYTELDEMDIDESDVEYTF